MDKDIINHPWGQSRDWTNEVKDYSPTHWLSGPPRAPYGYQGQVSEMPPGEPQMPPESEQDLPYGGSPTTSGSAPYSPVYPAPGIIYAPEPYNQYVNPDFNKTFGQGQSQKVADLPVQNQTEEKTDWYKVIYTASIVLMGIGSIAVAAIQYKAYTDKKKIENKGREGSGYHYDIESESESD